MDKFSDHLEQMPVLWQVGDSSGGVSHLWLQVRLTEEAFKKKKNTGAWKPPWSNLVGVLRMLSRGPV